MQPRTRGFLLLWIVWLWALLIPLARTKTNSPDVSALNVMYSSLNSPSQLKGWKSSGGDPCGESWKGIKCSGSSVTEIKLSGLGLTGSMGYQLSSLTSVTHFDLSANNLKGDIPYQLPPNAVHIDLSKNGLTNSVPYSISLMSDLKYLNLGHNQLNGQLSDMFGKLPKLSTLDLSYNSLTGNLPRSFGSLSSLTTLYVQNNQFTGSINALANLPLDDLNISNNEFSGWIPDKLKDIKHIETEGNSWSSGPAPPGLHRGQSGGKSAKDGNKKSGLSGMAIAWIVVGSLLAFVIIIALFLRWSSRSSSSLHYLDEERLSQRRSFSPLTSKEFSSDVHGDRGKDFKELKSVDSSCSISVKALQTSPSAGLKPPPTDRIKSFSDNEFANRLNVKRSTSVRAGCYSLSDLQTATGNFDPGRLLGEGSIGRVYRAKYADGKVFAVKRIDASLFKACG